MYPLKDVPLNSADHTSLQKGLLLLQRLASANDGMSMAELTQATGFNRATTYRLADALEKAGWVQRVNSRGSTRVRRVSLGPKSLGLAVLINNNYDLERRLQPQIEELARSVGETVHAAILDHTFVVHVARAAPSHGLHMAAAIGSRAHAHLTALGKAILATLPREELIHRYPQEELPTESPSSIGTRTELLEDLDRVVTRGYAIDNEESRAGVMCVGVPIFGPSDIATFAISVTTLPVQLAGERLDTVVNELKLAAAQASASLGGTMPPTWSHHSVTADQG